MTSHMERNDYTTTWCDGPSWTDTDELVNDLAECNCRACLVAIEAFGAQARDRRINLGVEAVRRMYERRAAKGTP